MLSLVNHAMPLKITICAVLCTARLSCIHQWRFKCWHYTQYANFQKG